MMHSLSVVCSDGDLDDRRVAGRPRNVNMIVVLNNNHCHKLVSHCTERKGINPMETRLAVIGAGTMGSGIAQSAIVAGYPVWLTDRDPGVVARAAERIGASLDKASAAGRLTPEAARAAFARLHPAADAPLETCALVIEAIIEDEGAKLDLLAAIAPRIGAETVIATNTSCLSVSRLARGVADPGRFVGLHYFFPAAVNPLLEVIAGENSRPEALEAARAFGRATGKTVIDCADVAGFAVNRFFVPYLNEAIRLADEGAAPADIERVARVAFGTKAGPFRIMDLSKTEIALHAAQSLEQLGPFYRPAPGLVAKVRAGGAWAVPETEGTGPDDSRIGDRLVGAVLLAVLEARRQRVASDAEIDLGARLGLHWGFQPCAEIARRSADDLRRLVEAVAAPHHHPLPV